MWGDAQKAADLDVEHSLATLLFQCSGPASLKLNDTRWKELLLQYEILVHLDPQSNKVVQTACHAMARHAVASSNLAALTIHVCRMLKDLLHTAQKYNEDVGSSGSVNYDNNANNNDEQNNKSKSTDDDAVKNNTNSTDVTLMGKARATCGAVNLLRILAHSTIYSCCILPQKLDLKKKKRQQHQKNKEASESKNDLNGDNSSNNNGDDGEDREKMISNQNSSSMAIQESFTYRETTTLFRSNSTSSNHSQYSHHASGRDVSTELLSSLTAFISLQDPPPFIYDALVCAMDLLLVLLSTQLYQPMLSSTQISEAVKKQTRSAESESSSQRCNFFLDLLMSQSYYYQSYLNHQSQHNNSNDSSNDLEVNPRKLLSCLLSNLIKRPTPPVQSIAFHYSQLYKTIVESRREEVVDSDGLYENHFLVHAEKPSLNNQKYSSNGTTNTAASTFTSSIKNEINQHNLGIANDNDISLTETNLDAINVAGRGALVRPAAQAITSTSKRGIKVMLNVSSAIILLPFRLVRLAMSIGLGVGGVLLGAKRLGPGPNSSSRKSKYSTNDVIWLSDSAVGDLSSCLFLLLTNNYRSNSPKTENNSITNNNNNKSIIPNVYRDQLASLQDYRWQERSPTDLYVTNHLQQQSQMRQENMSINFESLFQSFGKVLHNELGSLLLYTFLQSSPAFSQAMAVRSDLDTLVIPLLRTLYFSSVASSNFENKNSNSSAITTTKTIGRNDNESQQLQKPFRSPSQLYVILILLLLFSQDLSFGPDAFRRTKIPSVDWYKERNLKDISLGSLLILTLLRSITYNLNRLQDMFLLSNCCAVLMNLSPHVVELHAYASMRLAHVLVSCCKRYNLLFGASSSPADENMNSVIEMYGEVCQTLLQLVRNCLRRDVISKNLQLVYALAYMQEEFNEVFREESPLFKSSDVNRIRTIIVHANTLIQESGATLSASQAMEMLSQRSGDLITMSSSSSGHNLLQMSPNDVHHTPNKINNDNSNNEDHNEENIFDSNGANDPHEPDFTFTYEEELDPEVFFIPYVWEVIVCVVTAGSIEWSKPRIKVFPLNNSTTSEYDGIDAIDNYDDDISESDASFSLDMIDVV